MRENEASVIMIGNSHIDAVWLWRDREGLQEVKSTFSSALDRMEEFPEFEFTASSAAYYAWLEKNCPQIFQRIANRVKEGRWHLAGGWWVEPDANIPGGESMVRQGLYGQRYFLKSFGRTAETAYLADSFGHSCGLPKIFAGQRLSGFVFMRPQPWELPLPAPVFAWQDEDGSMVIACRIQGEYCAWTKTAIMDNLKKSLEAMKEHNIPRLPVFYGVGNHGGGPTVENIKAVRELQKEYPDTGIRNGSLEEFFKGIDMQTLPAYRGEMEGCFPGCFTTDSELKRLCRLTEELLQKAETLCAIAMQFGFPYPADALRDAWQLLLFQQFHDTLAGTARREARDDACDDMRRCLSVGREAVGCALQAVSAAIDTRGDGFPLLLVNTCDASFDGVIDADIYWRSKHPMRLKDAAGIEVAYDFSSRNLVSPDSRKHVTFRASVPAFGFTVYRMIPEAAQIPMEKMDCERNVLGNRFLHLQVNENTGCVESFRNKETRREFLLGPVTLSVYEDKRDTWGARGEIGSKLGEYTLKEMFVLEAGCVRTSLLIRMEYGHSEAIFIWSLGRDDPFVTVEARLDNREKHTMTVLRFPFSPLFSDILSEGPYSEQSRPYDEKGERHCQRYCDLQGDNASLLIVNEAKYGYRVEEGAYEVLVSRTPIHAFGSGEIPERGREYAYCDQGGHVFSLRLWPHGAQTDRIDRVRAAQSFHRPVEVLQVDQHEGGETLRQSSLFQKEGLEGAMIHLIKQGEDGGLVARLQNLTAAPVKGALLYEGKRHPVACDPYHLVSLRITREGTCCPADLLELD
jgi:alpha-mannosidase